jgi:hypothetical protein
MAFVARMSLNRDSCGAEFPPGTAQKLRAYRGPGTLHLFSPDDVPSQAFLVSDRKTITDFISINARLTVCPEARDAIEELEPGLHQFFPVKILRSRGKRPIFRIDGRVLETPYYVLNPGVRLDAVDLEKSDVQVKTFPHVTLVSVNPGRWDAVVLRRSVVAGRHIWKGQYQLGMYTFFSDQLVEIYHKRKWRGLEFKHVAEA